MIRLPRLYAIADASFGNPVETARCLFEGGARLVQIRDKNASSRDLHEEVQAVLRSAPSDAVVVVNDRADVAVLTGAGGVHLGQDDLPPGEVRRLLGPSAVIGLSTHSMEQAQAAAMLPVDYIAVGPIFTTTTKKNPDAVIGIELLSAICRTVQKPVVAIGGITLERAPDVIGAGAASIAVIGDLLKTANIADRTRVWLGSILKL